jgi:hypothetical protein
MIEGVRCRDSSTGISTADKSSIGWLIGCGVICVQINGEGHNLHTILATYVVVCWCLFGGCLVVQRKLRTVAAAPRSVRV